VRLVVPLDANILLSAKTSATFVPGTAEPLENVAVTVFVEVFHEQSENVGALSEPNPASIGVLVAVAPLNE
jgi:hypothetical protein